VVDLISENSVTIFRIFTVFVSKMCTYQQEKKRTVNDKFSEFNVSDKKILQRSEITI